MTTPSSDDGKAKAISLALPTIHMQEVSSLLTPEKLDGTNYVEWALNAQNKIRGRKRWGFISSSKATPEDTTSDEYKAWEDDNCMIRSWLLDSMNKEIRSIFLRLSTAKEIWDMAKQTYSISQDASKSYQLYCEVISVRQNGGSIVSYWGQLQKLWQEIDAIDDCAMKCKADIEIYTTRVNYQRVYIFLAGLDSQLDGVRGRVLATVPLPNAQIAYAMVRAEANRQNAMMGGTSTNGTAMAARRSSTRQDTKKGMRKCTHCNGDNHVVDTCFKLHGYPDWHPKAKKNSSLQPPSVMGLVAQTETRKFYTSMDVVFDESKLHYSTIGFESADVPENVLQSINSDDALCFDINSVTISTSVNTRESLEDKTTVDNPQVSSDQCENSPHLPDSTLSPLAPVSSSPETLQTVGLRDLPMDAMFFPSIDLMDGVDHLSMNPPDELHQDRKS
ncbi:hypothetical protein MRB53_018787 [Persea americana]|uniref:Uncharacterized protein n=1 Tax=Persea americana TaxID=3435 RepID=A0ACC2M9K8_PERAE|nr:hypothetical protein MRB53_018787 [Persea americana]